MMTGMILLFSSALLGQSGMIAYITGASQETYQLAVIEVQSGETTLLGQGRNDAYPAWSPDARQIAYQSRQPDGTGIRIAVPEEQSDQALKHRFTWNYAPAWSPCGTKIAYSTDGDAAPLQSIIVQTLETGEEQVWGGTQRGMITPVWFSSADLMKALDPDDQEAAETLGLNELKREADEDGALLAIGLSGTPPRISTELFVVTPSLAVPLLPFLAPDSRRYVKYGARPDNKARQIAYESNDGGDREVFILGRRGIHNMSNHHAADWNPVWSPDDNWLAFESFRDGRRGVYRSLVSTANVTPVAIGDTYDCWSPSWSPDGEWLAFVSDMTGIPQVFTVRPDGADLQQLTHGDVPALSPAWQPKPRKKQE